MKCLLVNEIIYRGIGQRVGKIILDFNLMKMHFCEILSGLIEGGLPKIRGEYHQST